MNSVWYSLLWKEWREHRWKLAALAAIFLAIPLLYALGDSHAFFGACSMTLFLVVPLASMFLGMSIAAGEQSRRTIHFLQALPASMAKPAAAKLLWAAITITVPVLLAVGAARLWGEVARPAVVEEAVQFDLQVTGTAWGLKDWFTARALAGTLAGVSILLWMAVAGVNRSDEIRAGAVGMLVMLVLWSALVYVGMPFRADNDFPLWWDVVSAAAPAGPASMGNARAPVDAATWRFYLWAAGAVALVSHAGLAAWYICRFGRVAPAAGVASEPRVASAAKAWLAPPRSRPLTAILWKQVRESAPLALLGAGMVLAAALVFALHEAWTIGENPGGVMLMASVAGWGGLGLFVSIVAGIGLFMGDMQPRLHAFWRSRPVSVDQWFAVKFVTGMTITLGILALPPLVLLLAARVAGMEFPDHLRAELREFGPMMLLFQAGLFCASVAAIVLVRQAAYACILAIAAAVATLFLLERYAGPSGQVAMIGSLAAVAATLLAWLAVRNDWGWEP